MDTEAEVEPIVSVESIVTTEAIAPAEPIILAATKLITSHEAKREARRKRILQNSSNRLEKITGRPHKDEPVTRDMFGEIPPINEIHEDPEIEREIYERPSLSTFNANTFRNESFNLEPDFLQSFLQAPGNNLFTQQSFNFPQQTTPNNTNSVVKPLTVLESIIDSKIHIAIISTIVYVLFATGNQVYTSNNVFLYLLLWELAEMVIIKPKSKSHGGVLFGLASAFLLKNIDPKIRKLIFSALNTINKVFKDVAIFMFVFVCIHIGWEYFGSQEPKTFNEILGK